MAAVTKTGGDKNAGGGQASHHASARSASHGGGKGQLGVSDAPFMAAEDYSHLKLSTSAAPSPRSTSSAPGSGAASPLATIKGGHAAHDPDTPKSRLLHSVMGALEAYASSAGAESPRHNPNPPHPHQHQLHQQPSSASSSPARARSDSEDGTGYGDPAFPPRAGMTGRPGLPRPPSAARPKGSAGRQVAAVGGRGLAGSGGSSSHLSDSDDGMEREEERLGDQVRALNRSLHRVPLLSMPWAASPGAPSPSSAPSPTAFGPSTPPPHHPDGKPGAGGGFRKNALFVNPSALTMCHPSLGSNSDSEALLYYDDYHQAATATATRSVSSTAGVNSGPGSRSPGKLTRRRPAVNHAAEPSDATAGLPAFLGLALPPGLQRVGGLLAFVAAAMLLGAVTGFLMARVALPPLPPPTQQQGGALLAHAGSNPSSSSAAAAMATALQQEEAKLKQQQALLNQQQQRLSEQQQRQAQLQRELEAEAAAASGKLDNSRAVMVHPKACPCDGVPLFKILWGRFRRTLDKLGRLLRFVDKHGKNRGARRRDVAAEGQQEEGIFEF